MRSGGGPAGAGGGLSSLKRTKTATAPVLMMQAYFRARSIGRMGLHRALCEAARSAAADSPCQGSGSAAKTLFRPCIRRLSVAAGTARARWLRELAAACWSVVLPVIVVDPGRVLGPVLRASAREHWPFFVLRDSSHAQEPVGRNLARYAGMVAVVATHAPSDLPLMATVSTMGAGPCCVGVLLSDRAQVARTLFSHA